MTEDEMKLKNIITNDIFNVFPNNKYVFPGGNVVKNDDGMKKLKINNLPYVDPDRNILKEYEDEILSLKNEINVKNNLINNLIEERSKINQSKDITWTQFNDMIKFFRLEIIRYEDMIVYLNEKYFTRESLNDNTND